MGLVHGGALFVAHGEVLVARAGDFPPRAERNEHRLEVLDRAAHPFQFGIREAFPDKGGAYLMIGERRAVVALGHLIQHDGVVLDVGGLELLGDALFHVAGGLPHLEKSRVRLIVNRIGVDARTRLRLRCQDFLDALTHRVPPMGLKGSRGGAENAESQTLGMRLWDD